MISSWAEKRITKDGRVRWSAVYRDPTGKKCRAGSYKTKDEAKFELAKILQKIGSGTYQPTPLKKTFNQCADEWLSITASGVNVFTLTSYKDTLRAQIKPVFGTYPIHSIKNEVATKLISNFSSNIINLSKKYKSHIYFCLNSVFKYAFHNNLISKNPLDGFKKPRISKKPKKIKILNPQEIRELIKTVETFTGHYSGISKNGRKWRTAPAEGFIKWRQQVVKTFYKIEIFTGLRPCEICALQWTDIDFDKREVDVSKSLRFFKEREQRKDCPVNWIIFPEPKTPKAIRKVPLTTDLIKDLQILKIESKENPWNFVFTAFEGGPISEAKLYSRHFKPDLKRAGIEPMHLYKLRHTYASMLYAQGIRDPKKIQELMGHEDYETTMNIYTQLIEMFDGQNTLIANKLEEFVYGNPQGGSRGAKNILIEHNTNKTY